MVQPHAAYCMAVAIEMSFPLAGLCVRVAVPLVFPIVGCACIREQVVVEPDVLCQFVIGTRLIVLDHACKLSGIMYQIGISLRTFTIVARKLCTVPLAVAVNNVEAHLLRQRCRCIADGQHHIA